MSVVRAMRRRAYLVVGPVLGIALTGYFAHHLVEGERGFKAWLRLNGEIRTATANLEAVRAQRRDSPEIAINRIATQRGAPSGSQRLRIFRAVRIGRRKTGLLRGA